MPTIRELRKKFGSVKNAFKEIKKAFIPKEKTEEEKKEIEKKKEEKKKEKEEKKKRKEEEKAKKKRESTTGVIKNGKMVSTRDGKKKDAKIAKKNKKEKAKKFLEAIGGNNVYYFNELPIGSNFIKCCEYLYSDVLEIHTDNLKKGAPVDARKFEGLIDTILKEEEFQKDTGSKYLEALKGACHEFLEVSKANENNNNHKPGMDAYEKIVQAFKNIYQFSSKTESALSFLSDEKVKNYIEKQSEILENSLKIMKVAL